MIPIDLTGKTALVTGASQGLGQAIATRLHAAGANVMINYFEDIDGKNLIAAEAICEELGINSASVAADVRDDEAVEVMVEHTLERFGGLDIVVNNAGILRDRTMKRMSNEEWQAVIDTNLTGVFHVCRSAEKRINDGGRIVNLASIASVVGFFGQSNYAAAKAGVMSLTKVLAKELARKQVTVNAVAPGVVLTEMGKTIPEEVREQMIAQIPLARFGEADDIANAVLYLASDLSSYVTGQTLHVNGGWWG